MHIVATAGHVDHGKSTLVKSLTGSDPDRFIEEKTRGLTIDLGFASTTLPSGTVLSIIDVPGHVRFLKNMLAGVGSVQTCLFVVAATEGWKPQSEEHLRILELLGFKNGIIVVTKVDQADNDITEVTLLEIEEKVKGTFLENAPLVKTNSLDGTGIDVLLKEISELLKDVPDPDDVQRPRLWIDRFFSIKGTGTVVTGTLTGGSLKIDDDLEIWPLEKKVRVRGIQAHYLEQKNISPGSRCALNIAGISHGEISRGNVLIRSGEWHLTKMLDASLQVLEEIDHHVSRRGAFIAYFGSGEYPVKLRVLGPNSISPGEKESIRLFLPEPLPLLPGDRFILRESGRDETVGGGEVLDVDPQEKASKAKPDRSIERIVKERGWIDIEELKLLTGESIEPDIDNWVVDPVILQMTIETVKEAVESAGPSGIELSSLNEHQRATISLLKDMTVDNGRLKLSINKNQTSNHPFVEKLQNSLFAPPDPVGIDRSELRELVHKGIVIEEGGIFFSANAIEAASLLAAELLSIKPDGFTVSEFREAAGNTRKHAMPLLNHLDGHGITRRRDSVRIAGPRLPGFEASK
ncbi:MAG: selenocysteine-specific translation elongation factor [Acidimicrobiales bacterium]